MGVTFRAGSEPDVYDDGYLYCELDRFYLACGGRPVYSLSRTEFLILSRLLREPGRPVAPTEIWQFARQGQAECNNDALRVHIANLRHKLTAHGVAIISKMGIGYLVQVTPPGEDEGAAQPPKH
jgi:DNA-binding response OmpR family regulator